MADYANIRDLLGHYVGLRIVEITQHDEEEFKEDGVSYVMLHFDNGNTLRFDISDDGGFHYQDESGEDEQSNA